jgi:hypothetical protein
MAVRIPEPAERAAEAQCRLIVPVRGRGIERRTEVVVVGLETAEPKELVTGPQARIGLFGEAGELERVAPEELLFLAGLAEVLSRVLADRAKHREPRLARIVLALAQETAIDERGDSLERVKLELAVGSRDTLGRLQGGAAHENGQARVQTAFLVGEEVVAPGDRLAESALAGRHVRASCSRKLEAALEAAEQRRGRQHLAPRSRELDGKGKPVEPLADLRDDRGRLVGQLEIGPDGARPLHEQHHRLVLGRLRRRPHTG